MCINPAPKSNKNLLQNIDQLIINKEIRDSNTFAERMINIKSGTCKPWEKLI